MRSSLAYRVANTFCAITRNSRGSAGSTDVRRERAAARRFIVVVSAVLSAILFAPLAVGVAHRFVLLGKTSEPLPALILSGALRPGSRALPFFSNLLWCFRTRLWVCNCKYRRIH